MLEELLTECAMNVQLDGEDLIVGHVYIERQMIPLNLYIRSASPEQAELAVIDYGQAIRDLAYTNIFAGDLLLKNFGVTRHNRVIFYDYDELCRVTDCRFRDMPQATSDEDEMRAEELVLRRRQRRLPGDVPEVPGIRCAARERVPGETRRDPRSRLVARAAGAPLGGRRR